ncbi:MAG: response regulator [Bacteroidetes bacterium]|nr:response regulator [Bacteroidota bacterium]
MNGFECLNELKKEKRLSGIPVIIYTTSDDGNARNIARDLGAKLFLTKLSTHQKLHENLKLILETI